MIPRNSSKAQESVKNDVNAFIPANWKLWALVFESIASKDSNFNEKKNLELIDGTEVDPTSFEDAIMSLYYETCNLVQRKFPIAIYELKNEDSVLLEITKLVERIRDAYLKAEKFIESEKDNVRRASKKVFENCEYILSILDIKRDMERFEKRGESNRNQPHFSFSGDPLSGFDSVPHFHSLECEIHLYNNSIERDESNIQGHFPAPERKDQSKWECRLSPF